MSRLMKMMRVVAMSAGVLASLVTAAGAETKIGVLAKRGAPETMREWGPTAAYLSEKLGSQFTIIPLKFEAIEPAVKDGTVDFVLTNSSFFVTLEDKYKASAIATLVNSREGKSVSSFGGVVFARADSPIQELGDIKGKKFMCVKQTSFGGCQMAWRLFLESGIDPKKDFAAFLEGNTHDNVVLAVKNGAADAGTVRSDTLEHMQDEGKIKMSDVRVIHPIKDDFPFVHSTVLYPEWPMAATAKTDQALRQKVADALMAMPADSPAAKAAKVSGWTKPADYASVKDVVKTLGEKYGIKASD